MKQSAILIMSLFVIGVLVSGCGGSGSGQGGGGGSTGQAKLTVHWAAAPSARLNPKLIPLAAQSIKITILQGSTQAGAAVIAAPQTSATITGLPAGTLTAHVIASPNADGSGVALASADLSVTITAGQTTQATVTLASTIDHLDISPTSPSVAAGSALALTATAKDAAGNVVLTTASKLQWQSSDTTLATVDGNGLVTGVKAGAPNITVTETESSVSKSVPVTVTDVTPPAELDIYTGPALAPGFDMGVNTSGGLTNWVIDHSGYMECQYPTGQSWGAVFITTYPQTPVIADRKTIDVWGMHYLSIDLKGASGGETVGIGVKTATDPDNGAEPLFTANGLTTSWQTFKIPLSALTSGSYPQSRFTSIYVACELVFSNSEDIDFQNIKYVP